MMQCSQIRQQLETMTAAAPREDALVAHLQQCPECRDYAEELHLRRLLSTLPLREPSTGFEARVLEVALNARRNPPGLHARRGWWLATAASVVLAVLLTLQFQPQVSGPQPVADLLQAEQTPQLQPVSVLLNSARPLKDATITVILPSHLALEGYQDSQQLQWQVNLSAGGNKLMLPLRLRQDENGQIQIGEIAINLEHDGLRKQFRVPVRHGPRTGVTREMI